MGSSSRRNLKLGRPIKSLSKKRSLRFRTVSRNSMKTSLLWKRRLATRVFLQRNHRNQSSRNRKEKTLSKKLWKKRKTRLRKFR